MEHPPPMPSVSDGKNSGNSLLLPLPRENFLATVAKRFFRNFTVTYRRNRLRTFPVWNPLRPPVNISGDGSTFWAMVCLRFYYKMIRRFARWVRLCFVIDHDCCIYLLLIWLFTKVKYKYLSFIGVNFGPCNEFTKFDMIKFISYILPPSLAFFKVPKKTFSAL